MSCSVRGGLKLAHSQRHVIAAVSHESPETGLGERAALRKGGVLITIAVLRDESLAPIELKQARPQPAKAGVEKWTTPLEDVASTDHGTGFRLRCHSELRHALAQAERSDRSCLIACPVKAKDHVDKT
jgi:thiamine pyrophosphate-dependent acetolactate synthase large subunit-like protein